MPDRQGDLPMKRVAKKAPGLKNVLRVDEGEIRAHVDEVVRSSVEETLNGLLDAEADRLCGAGRYERTPERVDTRAGGYERTLHTKAGEVVLRMPKLRSQYHFSSFHVQFRAKKDSVSDYSDRLLGGERAAAGPPTRRSRG